MQNALLEHSAILLTFIKLPFVIKIFDLSIFEWPFYTACFTVLKLYFQIKCWCRKYDRTNSGGCTVSHDVVWLFYCIKTTFRLNVGVGSRTELTQEGVQFLKMLFNCFTVLKLYFQIKCWSRKYNRTNSGGCTVSHDIVWLFDCIKTTFRLNVGVGGTTKLTQEGVQFLTMLFDCFTVLKLYFQIKCWCRK